MAEFSPPFSPEFDVETSWVRRRIGAIAGLLLVLAVTGAASWWFFLRDTSVPVAESQQQTATAANGTLVTTLSTTGTASASVTSRLTFGAAAKVTSVSAKVGDKVEAGQELGRLDTADLERKLESANVALSTARLRLSDLMEPATASDLSSAQAAITAAQVQVANADENLRKAQPGADLDAIATADGAVATAEQGLTNANGQVQSAWISLTNAQRTYCTTDNRLTQACYESDLPLTEAKIDALIQEIRHPATNAVASAAQALISANTSYTNSLTGVENAEKSLQTAKDKRKELDEPPTATETLQLSSAIQSAQAALLSAQQRYDDLLKGADATDVAQQQESVKSAEIGVETAEANLEAAVLRAPFAGTVTAVGVAVGDNVTAATAAFTVTNTEAIRIDLNVQEADFVGLAAGQYGTATFDALEGYTYLVRVISVNPSPSTNQGIVSYQVQTEVLGPSSLADEATRTAALQALTQLSAQELRGAGAFPAGGQAGGTQGDGAPAAVQTAAAGGQAPNGGQVPGGQAPRGGQAPAAGPRGGPGGNAGQAGALTQAITDAPTPTPGMTANVTILKSVVEDSLLVPNNAIRSSGVAKSVTVRKDDGTTEQRMVQTGATDGTNTVVTSGLTAGEVVVVSSSTATVAGGQQPTGQFPGGGFIGGPGGGAAPGGGNNGATGGVR